MYAHWGVDVSTSIKQAKVYAMTCRRDRQPRRLRRRPALSDRAVLLLPRDQPPARRKPRCPRRVGGPIVQGTDHVHVTEIEPGCGIVDPRRPTGPLIDPKNNEHPTVENLSADVANAAAYRIFPAWRTPDPAKLLAEPPARRGRLPRRDLRHAGQEDPRPPPQPLMVAAVRSWLAPLTKTWRRYGKPITAFDGSTWLTPTRAYYNVMAHGSIHVRSCFTNPARRCENRYILHVAKRGLDTRHFPDHWTTTASAPSPSATCAPPNAGPSASRTIPASRQAGSWAGFLVGEWWCMRSALARALEGPGRPRQFRRIQ